MGAGGMGAGGCMGGGMGAGGMGCGGMGCGGMGGGGMGGCGGMGGGGAMGGAMGGSMGGMGGVGGAMGGAMGGCGMGGNPATGCGMGGGMPKPSPNADMFGFNTPLQTAPQGGGFGSLDPLAMMAAPAGAQQRPTPTKKVAATKAWKERNGMERLSAAVDKYALSPGADRIR